MKTYFEVKPTSASEDDAIENQQVEITEGLLDSEGQPVDPQMVMEAMIATQVQRTGRVLNGKVQPVPEVKYYQHKCYHDEIPVKPCEMIEIDPETMEPIEGVKDETG